MLLDIMDEPCRYEPLLEQVKSPVIAAVLKTKQQIQQNLQSSAAVGDESLKDEQQGQSSVIDECVKKISGSFNNNNNNFISNNNNNHVKYDKIEKDRTEERTSRWRFTMKDLKWSNIILITIFHLIALVGFTTFPYIQKYKTFLWSFLIGISAAFGVTGGVHRFWTHRAYKAKLPLRIFLMICYVAAGQNSIYQWVRDHRVHHKFSETDADPHNATRGFFFSHVGWLMLKKHPDVLSKGKTVDMSDILADPVVRFQEKYFILLKIFICFVIPISVPMIFWGEDFYYAFLTQIARYIYVLNATWSVNSFAHIWGNKPYNRSIAPVENRFVSWATFGEGWHNYHHCFPMDYRAAEIGGGRFNTTTSLINFFAKIGWAYELKEPSDNLVKAMIMNRGDGTHESLHHEHDHDDNDHHHRHHHHHNNHQNGKTKDSFSDRSLTDNCRIRS